MQRIRLNSKSFLYKHFTLKCLGFLFENDFEKGFLNNSLEIEQDLYRKQSSSSFRTSLYFLSVFLLSILPAYVRYLFSFISFHFFLSFFIAPPISLTFQRRSDKPICPFFPFAKCPIPYNNVLYVREHYFITDLHLG
jgi:hypothetical protein